MTNPAHTPADRLAAGSQRFEATMGTPAQGFIDAFQDVAPDFGRYILEWEFGDLYGRPGLDLKTREIVVVAACATLGVVGHGAVKMHIKAALKAGATRTEIAEALMQVGFAAGLPIAIGALEVAKAAFAEVDANVGTPAAAS